MEHGLFEQAAQSNYLENKVAHVYKLVKDFGNNIDEARIQFNSSIQLHQTMVFAKANAPDLQNNLYIENLEAFAEMLKRDILENNIRICLKHLIYAKAANDAIRQLGYFRWRFKFSPSFMYFRDRKSLQKYKDESLTRVESYLLPRVKKEVEWIEKQYNFSVVEF